MVFRWSAIALVWLTLTWATSAWAAPSVAERDTARNLMVEGDRLREGGDLPGALQCYVSAHAIMHVPTTGLAVAETQAQLGQLVEARSAALEVLGMEVAQAEPVAFTKARGNAAMLAAVLEARVCTVTTRVEPATAQYSLWIDDVELEAASPSVPFQANPGTHAVRVEAPGFSAQTRQVTFVEGAVQDVNFELVALPLLAAEENALAPLSIGESGYSAQSDAARHSARVRGFVGLGVGGVSLAMGIITGAVSWSQSAEIERHCAPDSSCSAALSGDLKTANTLGNIANVTIPLGVVGIAYGLYELLTLPAAKPPASRAALRFDLAPNAVLLRGSL